MGMPNLAIWTPCGATRVASLAGRAVRKRLAFGSPPGPFPDGPKVERNLAGR
jgi:hypothetical protein